MPAPLIGHISDLEKTYYYATAHIDPTLISKERLDGFIEHRDRILRRAGFEPAALRSSRAEMARFCSYDYKDTNVPVLDILLLGLDIMLVQYNSKRNFHSPSPFLHFKGLDGVDKGDERRFFKRQRNALRGVASSKNSMMDEDGRKFVRDLRNETVIEWVLAILNI
jgi:hypothetical protein